MAPNNATARAKWLIEILACEQPLQIADIGARITREVPVYRPRLDCGVAHLHGFEPEFIAFEELKTAAGENLSVYPYAVGKLCPAAFYVHHVGSLSSVFKFCASAATYLGKGLSTYQLKASALAADVVVQSYDLCAYCLEALKTCEAMPRTATRQYYRRLPADVLADQPAQDLVE